jgi:hypothetical protein
VPDDDAGDDVADAVDRLHRRRHVEGAPRRGELRGRRRRGERGFATARVGVAEIFRRKLSVTDSTHRHPSHSKVWRWNRKKGKMRL